MKQAIKRRHNVQLRSTKLNLGCGKDVRVGYVNVDNNPILTDRSVVNHDLNHFPYPFPDNQFEEVLLDHVLEHLENPLAVLCEIYRIGKNGCRVEVKSPHFSYNWVHPLHKSPISSWLFSYLDTKNFEHYGKTRYQVESIRLSWLKETNERRSIIFEVLNSVINFLANLHIGITQRAFCYWVGGFEEIRFIAIVKK